MTLFSLGVGHGASPLVVKSKARATLSASTLFTLALLRRLPSPRFPSRTAGPEEYTYREVVEYVFEQVRRLLEAPFISVACMCTACMQTEQAPENHAYFKLFFLNSSALS